MMHRFGGFAGGGFGGPKGAFGCGGFGGGFGGGNGWFGFIPMALHALFWIALIAVGIYLFRRWSADHKKAGNTALKTLDERFARGEINTEEYQQIKKDLLS